MLGCLGLWRSDFPFFIVLTSNTLISTRHMTFIPSNISLIYNTLLSQPGPGPASIDGDGQA